jgi:aspartate/methionine/tyrosine aminotransferase
LRAVSFSRRLPSSLAPNRISRALDAARARGRLLDLTESNPTGVGLRYPEPEILAALGDPRALVYTPSPRGLDEARVAVASYYARRHATVVDPAHIFLTASTSDAYAQLFKLLCDPGDAILVPRPSYPLFELLAGLEAVDVVSYPLRYHGGWYFDVEEVRRALSPRTRAVLVVNPNNPTGSFLRRGERAALEALCAERGLALISDEVFADYVFGAVAPNDGAVAPWVTTLVDATATLTFSLSGLSKLVGLPQLKLGWIHIAGPAPARSDAEARLELIADTYLSVGAPVQHAAARLLALVDDVGAQIRTRVRANRAVLARAVRGTALQLLDADGGWCAILRVPATRTEEEWALVLLDDGVVVHPGFFYDFDFGAHLVCSLLVDEATFAEGVNRLVARCDA